MEWGAYANGSDRLAQGIDVADEQIAPPVEQIDREEVGCAGNMVTSIVGHWFRLGVVIGEGNREG